MAVRTRPARAVLAGGTAALVIGLSVTLAGVELHSTTAFFAGSLVAGLGFGAAFNGTLRSLAPLAEPHERAGLMSTFFVLSYLAFSLPAIAAGLLAGHIGLQAASVGYGLLLVALGCLALVLMARRKETA
jgi:MFS family permease